MKTLIVIIFDSMNNSVFESQVLQPLLNRKEKNPFLNIHIVSFEKNKRIATPKIDGIHIHIAQRYPFIHHLCLKLSVVYMRRFLKHFNNYEILARGPFAGYIALKAASKTSKITIQARGLAAEEYAYNLNKAALTVWQTFCYKQLWHLETLVYGTQRKNTIIESVSCALMQFVQQFFKASKHHITIAKADIPKIMPKAKRLACYGAIRTELNLNNTHIIFCYSGSFKAWQCPKETLSFFKSQYKKNPNAFLLILTPHITAFNELIKKMHIPQHAVHIGNVDQKQLLNYVAAADFGLLFRKRSPVNIIARPTKALEYQAAGLSIIHNGTVDYVNNMTNTIYYDV